MAYRVELLRTAARQFDRLPAEVREPIRRAMRALGDEPRPRGCRKLSAQDDLYRIRVGDHRILYEVRDTEVPVLVVAIGHRRDVYR